MPTAIGVLAWRLGLGWLVGRRWALITSAAQGAPRRWLVPYSLHGGNLYVRRVGDAAELSRAPRALVQAAPGPLGVRVRPPTPAEGAVLDRGDWVVMEPTAEPVPEMVPPDLVWLWPLWTAIALVVIVRRRIG